MRRHLHIRSSRLALVGLLALSLACATGGAPQGTPGNASGAPDVGSQGSDPDIGSQASDPDVGSQGAGATDPADPKPQQAQRGPSKVRQHAESGVEGMIVGTVIGGQIGGTTGAAVGAALFGLYGLVTGDVPFESGQGQGPRGRRGGGGVDDALEREVENELERQRALESEIEEELQRQEELLESISRQEELNESLQRDEEERRSADRKGDPLAAPVARAPRKIPDSIFDTEYRSDGTRERIVKTLDADRDGRPEIVIGMDGETGQLQTRAEDTNYDGTLDSTTIYDKTGKIENLEEDTNHDGVADRWTGYENEVGNRVEVDRDFDGIRDAFYTYQDGTLALEEHDTNGDGVIDRRVEYASRRRSVELEDRDFNGTMDFRTFYDEREIPVRTELDTNEDGQTDVWEYYEGSDPANILLVRKEEDLDADGEVDVTSHYSKGKLVRKEISDPSLY
jgi:hypothetical protein